MGAMTRCGHVYREHCSIIWELEAENSLISDRALVGGLVFPVQKQSYRPGPDKRVRQLRHCLLLSTCSYDIDRLPFLDDVASVVHSEMERLHQRHAPAPHGVVEFLAGCQLLRCWHERIIDVEFRGLLPGAQ
jgi:hypothetical protein